MPDGTHQQWVSPQEFAELLGVSANCVRKLCRTQTIRAKRVGRLYRIPLQEALDALPDAADVRTPIASDTASTVQDPLRAAALGLGLRHAA